MSARGETHPSAQDPSTEATTKRPGGQEGPGPKTATPVRESPCTDLANGQRFARQHAGKVKFVPAWRSWVVWDGHRWAMDDLKVVSELAKRTARTIYAEAARADGEKASEALARWAARSASDDGVRRMLSMASSDPRIVARAGEFDKDAYRLNTPEGEIDLHIGAVEKNDPTHLHTKATTVGPAAPGTKAPRWHAFLEEIFPDPELIAYVQRLLGYSMLGTVREHVFMLCWGGGANGKSTLLETVAGVLGAYAGPIDPALLLAKRNDAHPVGIADLQGLRFATAQETAQGRALDEAMVKNLTSGGQRKARVMRGNFFTYVASETIWLATNHLPAIRNNDVGIWRRMKLLPFLVEIPAARQDPDLTATLLQTEGPAILAWLVEGCVAYLCEGLGQAQAVTMATATYRAESDTIGQFLEECCIVAGDASVRANDLFEEYALWAQRAHLRVFDQVAFAREIAERGIEKVRTKHGMVYRGVSLRVDIGGPRPAMTAPRGDEDAVLELPDATQRRGAVRRAA